MFAALAILGDVHECHSNTNNIPQVAASRGLARLPARASQSGHRILLGEIGIVATRHNSTPYGRTRLRPSVQRKIKSSAANHVKKLASMSHGENCTGRR